MCSLSTSNIRISVVGKYGKYAVGRAPGQFPVLCGVFLSVQFYRGNNVHDRDDDGGDDYRTFD